MKSPWIRVADVVGVGDRDAHAEAVDDQTPEHRVRGVEDEAGRRRRSCCRR